MITVSISINGSTIYARSAVRTITASPNIYEVDTGDIIDHHYENGAVALAIKMLETIKEPGK